MGDDTMRVSIPRLRRVLHVKTGPCLVEGGGNVVAFPAAPKPPDAIPDLLACVERIIGEVDAVPDDGLDGYLVIGWTRDGLVSTESLISKSQRKVSTAKLCAELIEHVREMIVVRTNSREIVNEVARSGGFDDV